MRSNIILALGLALNEYDRTRDIQKAICWGSSHYDEFQTTVGYAKFSRLVARTLANIHAFDGESI